MCLNKKNVKFSNVDDELTDIIQFKNENRERAQSRELKFKRILCSEYVHASDLLVLPAAVKKKRSFGLISTSYLN